MSAPFTSYPYLPVWPPHSSLTAKLLYGLMLDRLSLSMKNGWFDDQNSKTLKSILVSCGARLAPFDIQEVRDITMYDELELDMLGDRKTALFLIMSDTDAIFCPLMNSRYWMDPSAFCSSEVSGHSCHPSMT